MHDWIEYLRERVRIIEEIDEKIARAGAEVLSPVIPMPSRAPDGYRPAWDPNPRAENHDHILDSYETEDGHEVIYCTACGKEW